eukprot:jgi/Tetstr1/434813/TSEL_023863.t1
MALAVRKAAAGGGQGRGGSVQYEVLLQEMLTKAGCDLSPDAPRDVRRLACHMHLFQELHKSGAFGGLTGLIAMVLNELQKSLYTDEVIANPLLGGPGGSSQGVSRLPFFAAIYRVEQEKAHMHAQVSEYDQRMEHFSEAEQQLRLELQTEQDRVEELQGMITRLEYELAKSRDRAQSAMDEMEINHTRDRESIQYLEHQLVLAQERSKDMVDENNMLRFREEVEVRMRTHFADIEHAKGETDGRSKQAPLTEQTHTIVTQLLTLQNGRIDDFENRLANAENAAIPSHETPEQVKFYFAAEMNSLHREIKELKDYQQTSEKREHGRVMSLQTQAAGEEAALQPVGSVPGMNDFGGRTHVDAPESASTLPASHTARMWHDFHVRAEGNELLIKPQVLRDIVSADLISTLKRILEANFLAVCPHVRWTNEGNRAQPRGRLHCSEAHPSRTARGQDAAEIAAHVHVPASEFFFSYLKERYGCHEVAMFVAHSILKAIERDQSHTNKVAMFGKLLAQDIDDGLWLYATQIEWLLNNHPRGPQWEISTQAQFNEFWGLLYPQLSETELSHAFREVTKGQGPEALSNSVVIDFIIGQLLHKTEHRFKRWVKVLKWKDTMNKNMVQRYDICSAAPKMFPDVDPKGVELAFCIAAQTYDKEHLPLETMAYLACHLEACTFTWTT